MYDFILAVADSSALLTDFEHNSSNVRNHPVKGVFFFWGGGGYGTTIGFGYARFNTPLTRKFTEIDKFGKSDLH